jgi:hypothetical protein
MLVRKKTTALLASGLLLLGVAACEGDEVINPAGSELDTDADGPGNGVQPDGEGPETYDDPVFGEDDEG